MIDVHYWPTPNGWKATIMLEECSLDYRLIPVDIGAGDQFRPEFLRISPNNRMPAIVDHEPTGGGDPISIFESGAILKYLAEKTGKFLPADTRGKYRVLQWVYWQMANLGPMMGNANHFKNYARNLIDDHTQLEYGANRFVGEVGSTGWRDGFPVVSLSVSRWRRIFQCRHYQLALGIPDRTNAWKRNVGKSSRILNAELMSCAADRRSNVVTEPVETYAFRRLARNRRKPDSQSVMFNQNSEKVRLAREAVARMAKLEIR